MELLSNVAVSAAGRPSLLSEEVELKVEGSVDILDSNDVVRLNDCMMILTNLRLIYIKRHSTTNEYHGSALLLSVIDKILDCSRFFSKSLNLKISYKKDKRSSSSSSSSSSSPSENSTSDHVYLRFTSFDSKDILVKHINKAISKASWVTISATVKSIAPSVAAPERKDANTETEIETVRFKLKNAGIGGLVNKQEKELQSVNSLQKDAMADMNTLMERAREVVSVVKKYSLYMNGSTTNKSNSGNNSGNNNSMTNAEMNEIANILQNIGIVSPITKDSAGELFHQEVARQLADILLIDGRLARMGGMITLTDAYCLYNRARGTELVSPEDLLEACHLMKRLNIGMRLQRFESGVYALQLDRMNEENMCKEILALFKQCTVIGDGDEDCIGYNGITATLLSKQLRVSVIIARQQLLLAETKGYLCRDESIAGFAFFPNLFNQY